MKIEHSTGLTNKTALKIIKELGNKAVYRFQPDDSPEDQEAFAQLSKEDGYSCLKVLIENERSLWIVNTDNKQVISG